MQAFLSSVSAFFREVGKSCYDLEFYRKVRAEPVRKSVIYLSRFYGALGLMGAAFFVPGLIAAHGALVQHVAARLPDGARFVLANGGFTTNLEMPFDIGPKQAPIIINTAIKGLELPTDFKSEVLVIGADAAFFPDARQGKTAVLPYAEIPAFSFTKDTIISRLKGIGGPVITLLGLALVLLWVSGVFVGGVLYVLSMAWLAWLASRASKVNIGYRQWFASGLRIMTLPTLLMLGFGATLGRIPFLTTIIFGMFAYAIITDERSNPLISPVPAPAGPPVPETPSASESDDEKDEAGAKEPKGKVEKK